MKRDFARIKLNEFSKNELDQRKLNELKGGRRCDCVNGWYCDCACADTVAAFVENIEDSGEGNIPDDYIY